MIACFDVAYQENRARAACVCFAHWNDAEPLLETAVEIDEVAEYEPGRFYLRELPCIRAALETLPAPPDMIIVDGYVTLSPNGEKGLGAHLFDSLGTLTPVIGVAKSAFAGATHAIPVLRGGSQRPLYVTAAGVAAEDAAENVRQMHGDHRLPTLLRRVDRLCRLDSA